MIGVWLEEILFDDAHYVARTMTSNRWTSNANVSSWTRTRTKTFLSKVTAMFDIRYRSYHSSCLSSDCQSIRPRLPVGAAMSGLHAPLWDHGFLPWLVSLPSAIPCGITTRRGKPFTRAVSTGLLVRATKGLPPHPSPPFLAANPTILQEWLWVLWLLQKLIQVATENLGGRDPDAVCTCFSILLFFFSRLNLFSFCL